MTNLTHNSFYKIRLFKSSTCFDQTRVHHQEVNFIDTASGTVNLCKWPSCMQVEKKFYTHHYELETMCVLLPRMVCNALVAGGRRSGAGQQAIRPG